VLAEDAFYDEEPRFQIPGPAGAHNWFPMAYSPLTGLVYLPAQEMPFAFAVNPEFEYYPGHANHGIDLSILAAPEDPELLEPLLKMLKGRILAWDPVAQKAAWTVEQAGPWNGGMLATAGNLIFQATPKGEFAAYRADNGEKLWSFDCQTGAVASPVTYQVGDDQYIAITVGWGTALAMLGGEASRRFTVKNKNRMLAFKLNATNQLPAVPPPVKKELPPSPDIAFDKTLVEQGKHVFYGPGYCFACHGDGAISGGMVSDLRYSTPTVHKLWDDIVLDGKYSALGMPGYSDKLSKEQSRAAQMYVLSRAEVLRSQLGAQE